MLRVALICVVLTLAGCGGSSTTSAQDGCHGVPTGKSAGLLVLFGAVDRLTRRDVCSRFGEPQAITRGPHGLVVWRYGNGTLSFRGSQVVSSNGNR